jgi:uncharacterized protein
VGIVKLFRRRAQPFEVRVQDLTLRITASPDLVEESRAAALTFWEQLQAYTLQHPEFRSSKRPLRVPAQAPEVVKEMVASAAEAGVGPIFALRGAIADQVGRILTQSVPEVTVECGGELFLHHRKRTKFQVQRRGGSPVAVMVEPVAGGLGVATTADGGRGPEPDGLAVVATTCMVAASAAAGVRALLPKEEGLRSALRYLERLPDVRGGIVIRGEQIGVAGDLELAS